MVVPKHCKLCGVELTTETRYASSKRLRCKACDRAEQNARQHLVKPPPHVKVLLGAAKHRAKRDGLPFNITVADIVIPEVCPVLGIPMFRSKGKVGVKDHSPTLDKLIPELGYVSGNVYVISSRANRIKTDATRSELQAVLAYVEKYSK